MNSRSLREVLLYGAKDVQAASYELVIDGADRHGAMEWTVQSRGGPDGLTRLVSAFESPEADDGTTQFELRGYACVPDGNCTHFITRTGALPDDDAVLLLAAEVYQAVEALTASDLRKPRA
ncbi:hypothetical protein ACIQRW_26980 [Streptomyces sp. NPDC091287]|uniref:hypothetical protein n=1 Tax=Streptomyces sp. NPDC091287 TaxID=3365988 RepID=UPI00380BC4E0